MPQDTPRSDGLPPPEPLGNIQTTLSSPRQYSDDEIRATAFLALQRLRAAKGVLTAADLQAGFQFGGERIPFSNTQRGIWKPSRMNHLLSIKTVHPRPGGRVWYPDQYKARDEVYQAGEHVTYAFQGTDPGSFDNQWLREAMDHQIPAIYFFGVAPGRYDALFPVFIEDWSAAELSVRVAIGRMAGAGTAVAPTDAADRRYAMREVKQRLHQASFREAVLAAYGARCAISGLPAPQLLDAAHIIPDGDEEYGAPIVPNGMALSKIHHAAFDGHMIGIDPDYRIHICEHLLEMNDGPILELGIKDMSGRRIKVPREETKKPDRERLERRFELFKETAA